MLYCCPNKIRPDTSVFPTRYWPLANQAHALTSYPQHRRPYCSRSDTSRPRPTLVPRTSTTTARNEAMDWALSRLFVDESIMGDSLFNSFRHVLGIGAAQREGGGVVIQIQVGLSLQWGSDLRLGTFSTSASPLRPKTWVQEVEFPFGGLAFGEVRRFPYDCQWFRPQVSVLSSYDTFPITSVPPKC